MTDEPTDSRLIDSVLNGAPAHIDARMISVGGQQLMVGDKSEARARVRRFCCSTASARIGNWRGLFLKR